MKTIMSLLLLLFISKLSSAQMNALTNPDLKYIVFNKQDLRKFMNNNEFIAFSATKFELSELNQPMGIYNFNRVVKDDKIEFKIFGISIKGLYGFVKNTQNYCLYIIFNIDTKEQIGEFITELGRPWNITEEDYEKGDFDMLLWQKEEFKISIMRNFDGNKLLTITNLPLAELINNSSW